jgi:chorismate-pyruvate lyase
MPIEDATVQWPEDESPYLRVARLTVGPQTAWSDARSKIADDRLAFGPWRGLLAHQPLGGIMRARKATYSASVQYRSESNGCPIHEPREKAALPD